MGDTEEVRAPRAPGGWSVQALERLPLPVMAIGARRRILFWNAACTRITGYTRAEALGDPEFLRRLYPVSGQLERLEAAWRQSDDSAAGCTKSAADEGLRTRDGDLRPIVWTALGGPQDGARIWHLGLDLTGRLATTDDLRHIETRYRMLVEHGRDLVTLHAPDGRFLSLSPTVEAVLGYRADELIGALPYDFIHDEDRDRLRRGAVATVMKGQIYVFGHYRWRRKDGRHAWLEGVSVPLHEDGNAPGWVTAVLTVSRDVSQEVEAAALVADSEKRLRLAMFATGIGVYEVFPQRPAGHHHTDEYLRILGYGPQDQELFLRGWEPLFHPEEAAALRQLRQEIARGQCLHFDREFRRMCRDGLYRWTRTVGRVVETDAEGRAVRVIGTLQDIDDRKAAERALSEGHDRLARAQELAHLGDWKVRLPAREYTWSAETFRILGLDPAAVTPSRQALLDRVHPDDRERLALALDAAVQDGHGVAFDSRIVRPDGTARVVHHQARAMRDGQGRLTGYHGTIQDISERKEVEQALRRATAELEHAQRIGKMGSWTWNVGDDSSQWSPALLEIYGRDPKGPAPTYAEMEGLLTPDSWARMQAAIGEAVTHGTPYTIELEVVRPDGAHRWVAGQAEVECDAQGRPARLVGTAQDFTERKLAELELRKTRDEVRELSRRFEEERDQERKRIAMDVHDEIGQLLTAMKHEIHLLRSHAGTAVASERGLQRLGELVDNSIEVTRNVAMTLRPPALDLGLTAALEWLAEDFELRSEIGCEVRVSGDDFVLDDRQAIALFRIAQESLTNVARHARARRVQIALDSAAGRLAMTINDDGRGFALASARQQGHFGLLGMQERAWRINATLSIDSRPGEGTSVHAELPVCRGGTR